MSYKDDFINTFNRDIHRPGAEKLLAWLEGTDFFTAPASAKYHGNHEGGLCEHSMNVWRRLSQECDSNAETVAICGLLHDVCKANFYKKDYRNVKNERGVWDKVAFYKVEDNFPYGHGEKSVYLINRFMTLTDEEAMAIRWHMGFSDESFKGGSYALSNAFERYPLAVSLHIADLQATYFDERKQEE